jgi:hypothetical protein
VVIIESLWRFRKFISIVERHQDLNPISQPVFAPDPRTWLIVVGYSLCPVLVLVTGDERAVKSARCRVMDEKQKGLGLTFGIHVAQSFERQGLGASATCSLKGCEPDAPALSAPLTT